jgi:hypothetical protein
MLTMEESLTADLQRARSHNASYSVTRCQELELLVERMQKELRRRTGEPPEQQQPAQGEGAAARLLAAGGSGERREGARGEGKTETLQRGASAKARAAERRPSLKVKAPVEPPVSAREAAMQERIDLVSGMAKSKAQELEKNKILTRIRCEASSLAEREREGEKIMRMQPSPGH